MTSQVLGALVVGRMFAGHQGCPICWRAAWFPSCTGLWGVGGGCGLAVICLVSTLRRRARSLQTLSHKSRNDELKAAPPRTASAGVLQAWSGAQRDRSCGLALEVSEAHDDVGTGWLQPYASYPRRVSVAGHSYRPVCATCILVQPLRFRQPKRLRPAGSS